MDSKIVIDMALTFSDAPFSKSAAVSAKENDPTGPADVESTESEGIPKNEPIRPFAYREPVGKSSNTDRFQPKRRSSDADPRGN